MPDYSYNILLLVLDAFDNNVIIIVIMILLSVKE